MNRDADRLDAAIDDVASRLVLVPEDDPALTQKIINALPDRSSRLRWLIPQFVALGAIVIAAFVWTARGRSLPATVVSSSALMPLSPLATTASRRTLAPGTQPLEPLEPMEPLEPPRESFDFERALSPIAPMTALTVSDVSTSVITAPAAIDLAPIQISEIPMTADLSPRQQE